VTPKSGRLLAILVTLATLSVAQVADAPRFEQFPVSEKFSGKPAAPVLRTANDRGFRTQIRTGAAEGPNFAGHLTIARWGCGSSCWMIAVIDARTGRMIHDIPEFFSFAFLKFADGTASGDDAFEPLSYRLDSQLLIMRGCPNEADCSLRYYEWNGSKFRLLRKLPATRL
jgi:hypothetical protein